MHSSAGRCADGLICLFGVYVLGRVEAENDTGWIAFHAESRKLIQWARPRTARVSRLRRKSVAKMKLAVLRQNGAGCPASVATTPPSEINANKIVHPSIITFLNALPFVCFAGGVLLHDGKRNEAGFYSPWATQVPSLKVPLFKQVRAARAASWYAKYVSALHKVLTIRPDGPLGARYVI